MALTRCVMIAVAAATEVVFIVIDSTLVEVFKRGSMPDTLIKNYTVTDV